MQSRGLVSMDTIWLQLSLAPAKSESPSVSLLGMQLATAWEMALPNICGGRENTAISRLDFPLTYFMRNTSCAFFPRQWMTTEPSPSLACQPLPSSVALPDCTLQLRQWLQCWCHRINTFKCILVNLYLYNLHTENLYTICKSRSL